MCKLCPYHHKDILEIVVSSQRRGISPMLLSGVCNFNIGNVNDIWLMKKLEDKGVIVHVSAHCLG